MKQYSSYKYSPIKWAGEIPQFWEIAEIAHFTTSKSGGTPDRNKKEYWENGTIPWMSSGEINKVEVFDTNEKITPLGLSCSSAKMLEPNTVMIALNGQGKTKGMSAILRIYSSCNQSLCGFMCDERCLNFKYLYYCFQSMYKYLRSQAGDDTREGLAASDIRKERIPVPSYKEQIAIVKYLEAQCANIDKVIAAQEKRVELLRELKQTIITRAVTHGINPDVKLKDSVAKWIGQIPEHWEIKKLKYLFSNLDYLRQPITADQRSKNNPIYDYYGASGIIDKIDFYNIDDTVLLIGEDGANLVFRNLPLIYKASGKFWVNNHAHILKPLIGVDYEYMYYTMECADYSTFITGSAQPKLSQENMNQVQYPLPPLSEQCKISKYIERKTIKIDSFITKALCQIELLKEYKQSLITEVVTGKRKVS